MSSVNTSSTNLSKHYLEKAISLADGILKPSVPQDNQIGATFYNGVVGVAFFLAALNHITKIEEYRHTSLLLLTPVRQKLLALAEAPALVPTSLCIGGLAGLGSFVYSFARIGLWLKEPELIAEALALLDLFDEERIMKDSSLDIIAGSAGLILSVLALRKIISEREHHILDIASVCSLNLLQRRISYNGLPMSWKTLDAYPPLSGFAHGASGISYSLLQLYSENRESALIQAAEEGLAFERSLYSEGHRNWRDMRFNDVRFMASWCHGAPGIGLARLGTLDVLDNKLIRHEIDAALEVTVKTTADRDHVCCGNMGLVDILLYAYQRLQRSELLQGAHDLAAHVLEKAQKKGSFAWMFSGQSTFNPSYFPGAAGVGYVFLRLSALGDLPCVLVME